jgi:DNA-3-methyladenine glycosylase II
VRYLAKADPVIARLIRHVGPCRLKRTRSHFTALVEAIVWQQLSWKAALTIHERLLTAVGTRLPKPADVLRLSHATLHEAGLSKRKAEYLIGLSEYFDSGRFPRRRIHKMSDDDIVTELTSVRGIGRWSAEMFLMFALNRLDVLPVGDLGLRKAIAGWYGRESLPEEEEMVSIAEPWRPYRTVASWYLWAGADGVPFD